MTKEEAKKKWCPHVRFGTLPPLTPVTSANRWINAQQGALLNPEDCRCIASECMAWRWSEATRTKAYIADVVAHAQKTGDNINKSMDAVWKAKGASYGHTEGYCGLAGRPE